MGELVPPFPGILGVFEPQYSTLATSRRTRRRAHADGPHFIGRLDPIEEPVTVDDVPSFLRILDIFFRHTQEAENLTSKHFITNVAALHEFAFSPKCPILGTGSNFVVRAKPFENADKDFRPLDGRAINTEVHCLKNPNLNSASNVDKDAFRKEYYSRTLQELKVLLHPQLRTCENIINLFGLDFQEDYDDHKIAWPVLIMEYAEFSTLNTLQEDIRFDVELERTLLLDVARGIQALHQCNIIHGDVKSENVLICRHRQRKYVARISDFGLSVINPDPTRTDHKLPGGTFLWSAPEFEDSLSVAGLRQTDVYSFGLLAWRVILNHPFPYNSIPPTTLGLEDQGTLSKTVTCAKAHHDFPQLVVETLTAHGHTQSYYRPLIESALGTDPSSRDLSRAINLLDHEAKTIPLQSEVDQGYWALGEPVMILDQVNLDFIQECSAVSVCESRKLTQLYTGNRALRRLVLVPILVGAFTPAQAITARYHEICGKGSVAMDSELIEFEASKGSFYAMQSIRSFHPQIYQRLMKSPLNFEPKLQDHEQPEARLITCCREGDFEGAKREMAAGASAFAPREDSVSALHWLSSFQDERQTVELSKLLVSNGAVLEAWEGERDDFTYGRVVGTPLHWAVWHRNLPAVRALTKLNREPDHKHVDRAICLAAALHFYDVLEILKSWTIKLKTTTRSKYDWHSAMMTAAENISYGLPRRLRHLNESLSDSFDQTMNIIISMQKPSTEDITTMFAIAMYQNHPPLLRYLFTHLGLGKRKDLFKPSKVIPVHPAFNVIAMGFEALFEIFIEQGILTPQTEIGAEKFRPLQTCCLVRQRNSVFAVKLIKLGCVPDDVGPTNDSCWTAFLISVALGMYEIAIILLEHGANKDYLTGWLGGSTVTMNLLQTWPDIPVSRLKFLLEEVPRLGFGHVTFLGWPGAGGNLLHALAMSQWSSYTAGSPLGGTAKYILSQLEDKTCLNRIDKLGATAFRMAVANGNLEIARALIDAGQDVNLSVGFAPIRNAKEWLETCHKRESEAFSKRGEPGSEVRLARSMRTRAQEVVQLMERSGARDRDLLESNEYTNQLRTSGQWHMPGWECGLEVLSLFASQSSMAKAGSTPLNQISKDDLNLQHGKKSKAHKLMGGLGKWLDHGREDNIEVVPRWQPHKCHPWRNDGCNTGSNQTQSRLSTVISTPPPKQSSALSRPASQVNSTSNQPVTTTQPMPRVLSKAKPPTPAISPPSGSQGSIASRKPSVQILIRLYRPPVLFQLFRLHLYKLERKLKE
ncbi:hypothetical protein G7Y89_g14414 [Cudoniella acicularis]|uniref:Protein kinase domain-containing protein n=1 Tax=Cudoniella acicularis TaxID=354080 RepID=A0A8H4R375_9HELO|nr:hypothetical protein G7Y89_g14414 [Cudoniella acicularis]